MLGRYDVQSKFPPIGEEGQAKLAHARVVVVGVGGLGSFLLQYFVRSGVGLLRFVDFDKVELSNLQRQILYDEGDVGKAKVESAYTHLKAINSIVELDPVQDKLTGQNAEDVLSGFDVIVDGSDNYEVRFVMNDFAKKHGIPFVFGSVAGAYGMAKVFLPEEPLCLRDVVGNIDLAGAPTASSGGLISPILGVITGFMAAETIKLLVGAVDNVEKKLFVADLWQNQWAKINVVSDPGCVVCQGKYYPALEDSNHP